MTKQVKSKKRVADHGEVFTAEREVNAMLDLVKQETERIDSRFLEPACGDGNFLAEILRRKLAAAKKASIPPRRKTPLPYEYERNAVLAISSIYGIDILQDNCEACRERMFQIWDKEYQAICKKETNDDTRQSVMFILSRNIVCGNALSLMCVDSDGKDTSDPIIFSEWAFITGEMMQRKDYTFAELVNTDEPKKKKNKKEQLSLFDDEETSPDEEGIFLNQYVANFRRLQENG